MKESGIGFSSSPEIFHAISKLNFEIAWISRLRYIPSTLIEQGFPKAAHLKHRLKNHRF